MLRTIIQGARVSTPGLLTAVNLKCPEQDYRVLKQHLHGSHVLYKIDPDLLKQKVVAKVNIAPEVLHETADKTFEDFAPETTYPTLETHNMMVGGQPYYTLPIVHIKATPNNTIMCTTDGKGVAKCTQSGGTVGFRNARKGTNIAAQAAAIAIGEQTLNLGMKIVRVKVKGIGPGRLPAIKGLQMAGLTVVSITDETLVSHTFRKPRKQRRL